MLSTNLPLFIFIPPPNAMLLCLYLYERLGNGDEIEQLLAIAIISMVLILDGKSEIGAQLMNNVFFYLFKAVYEIESRQKSPFCFFT